MSKAPNKNTSIKGTEQHDIKAIQVKNELSYEGYLF